MTSSSAASLHLSLVLVLLLSICVSMNEAWSYSLPLGGRSSRQTSSAHASLLGSARSSRCSTLKAGGGHYDDLEYDKLLQLQQQRGEQWQQEREEDATTALPGSNVAVFTVLSSVSILVCYADRSNLATAIIPMADQFHWDKSFEGVVLASFFLGYAVTQMLGGWLADRYNGRFVLMGGLAAWSFFTILTPSAAHAGAAPLVAARVGLGLGEGVAFPSIHALISQRVPPARQSTVVAIITAASYAGAFVAFGLSPRIIAAYNWEAVFHTFGIASLFLLPFWGLLGGDSSPKPLQLEPKKPGSASSELLAGDVTNNSADESVAFYNGKNLTPSTSPMPSSSAADAEERFVTALWDDLLRLGTKREVWAIIIAQFTQSVGMYGLLSWLPTYMHDKYNVRVEDLATFTTLPYALQAIVGMVAGVLADWLIGQQGWRVKTVRQLLQVTGMMGPAALLVCLNLSFASSAESGAALLAVGTALSALTLGGVSVNHLDIAPRSAGLVFGAGNTAATLAGFLVVPMAGWIFDTTSSWNNVFSLFAASYVIGAVLFVILVGSEDIDCLVNDTSKIGSGGDRQP